MKLRGPRVVRAPFLQGLIGALRDLGRPTAESSGVGWPRVPSALERSVLSALLLTQRRVERRHKGRFAADQILPRELLA